MHTTSKARQEFLNQCYIIFRNHHDLENKCKKAAILKKVNNNDLDIVLLIDHLQQLLIPCFQKYDNINYPHVHKFIYKFGVTQRAIKSNILISKPLPKHIISGLQSSWTRLSREIKSKKLELEVDPHSWGDCTMLALMIWPNWPPNTNFNT